MFITKTIRVGIIGLGIGRWHIESYLAIPKVKVTALCDIDEDKLKSMVTRYGIIRAYTDYEEFCKSDDIDAVSICVPNHLHALVAIKALEHGKHVFCEEPISNSVTDAENILDVSRKYPDLKVMVAMKFRFNRDAVHIRKMIQSGEMGNILYGFASYLKPLDIDHGKNNWRIKKALSGGGTLIDNGIQVLDLIWWIMGCPKPVEVFGNTYIRTDVSEVEDIANGMIRFENGVTITIESAWRSLIQDDTMTLRIFGKEGTANLWPFRIILENGKEITSRAMDHKGVISENQFRHFIQCIENKHQPLSTVEQSVTVMRMIDAFYRSAREKKIVII